jgi:hypothetical protein
VLHGQNAVLVEGGRYLRGGRLIVIGVVSGIHRAPLKEGPNLVEHGAVAADLHIAAHRHGQPQVVVGAARAHAAARGRVPPVLHVSLAELPGGAEQQVRPYQARFGMDQRHAVLQLVAIAKGAPRLVIAAARPQAAGQGLVDQPAVGQHVHGRVRGVYLHGAEGVLPAEADFCEGLVGSGDAPEACHQVVGLIGVAPHAQAEHPLPGVAGLKGDADLEGPAGVEAATDPAGQPAAGQGCRCGQAAIAADELATVRGKPPGRVVRVEKGHPLGKLGVVGVAGIQGTAARGNLGAHMHGRTPPQIAQHPLHIAVALRRRGRPESLRSLSSENFTAASRATKTVSSE